MEAEHVKTLSEATREWVKFAIDIRSNSKNEESEAIAKLSKALRVTVEHMKDAADDINYNS